MASHPGGGVRVFLDRDVYHDAGLSPHLLLWDPHACHGTVDLWVVREQGVQHHVLGPMCAMVGLVIRGSGQGFIHWSGGVSVGGLATLGPFQFPGLILDPGGFHDSCSPGGPLLAADALLPSW